MYVITTSFERQGHQSWREIFCSSGGGAVEDAYPTAAVRFEHACAISHTRSRASPSASCCMLPQDNKEHGIIISWIDDCVGKEEVEVIL